MELLSGVGKGLHSIEVVGWPKAPATRVHTTIGGSRFGLGLARTA